MFDFCAYEGHKRLIASFLPPARLYFSYRHIEEDGDAGTLDTAEDDAEQVRATVTSLVLLCVSPRERDL